VQAFEGDDIKIKAASVETKGFVGQNANTMDTSPNERVKVRCATGKNITIECTGEIKTIAVEEKNDELSMR
jgi:hypothetical protein